MSDQRWLAVFVAVIAVLLLVDGTFAAIGIDAANTLIDLPSPYDPQNVALAHELRPIFYLRALQAAVFGSAAIVAVLGLVFGSSWAWRLWLWASLALVTYAAVLIIVRPQAWDNELILVGPCTVTWWYLWKVRRNESSL